MLAVSWPHWICPHSRRVCFPCLRCLGSMLLCQELSEAGPGLYALPRSKPLRFKFSGSQRRRLGWACALCSSDLQNKGLIRANRLQTTHPPPVTGRLGQPEPEGGNRGPREASSTKLQAGFLANQDFLGFWTVNICLRRCAGCTPRKLSSRDGGGD